MIKKLWMRDVKGKSACFALGHKFHVFTGKNGSGKSSVLEAIRIGLSGYLSELGKTPAATLKLSSTGMMSIELQINDSSYVRTYTSNGYANKSEAYINGEKVTIKDMNSAIGCIYMNEAVQPYEFASMSSAKQCEFLMNLLCDQETLSKVEFLKNRVSELDKEIKRFSMMIQSVTSLKKETDIDDDEETFSDEDMEEDFLVEIGDMLGEGKLTASEFRRMYDDFRHSLMFIRSSKRDKVYNEVLEKQCAEAEEKRMQAEDEKEKITEEICSLQMNMVKTLESNIAKIMKPFVEIAQSAFGTNAYISFEHKGSPNFSFGIVKEGRKISFETMSGGEKTILATALIACLQKCKNDNIKIGFFELAEADENSFKAVITASEKLGYEQVFIASCHAPEDKLSLMMQDIDITNMEESSFE